MSPRSYRFPRTATAHARGSSLLEVLVAMGVLAVGITGVMGTLVQAARTDSQSRARTAATAFAQDLVNHIQNDQSSPVATKMWAFPAAGVVTPLRNVNTGNDTGALHGNPLLRGNATADVFTSPPDYAESSALPAGYPGLTEARVNTLASQNGTPYNRYIFRRYWNIAPEPANPALIYVAVIVTYSNGIGGRYSVTLHTAVHDQTAVNSAGGGVDEGGAP